MAKNKKFNPAEGLFGNFPVPKESEQIQGAPVAPSQKKSEISEQTVIPKQDTIPVVLSEEVPAETAGPKRGRGRPKGSVSVRTSLDNRGRKGHRQPRINLALYGTRYDFVRRQADRQGIAMTEYLNNLVWDEMERELIRNNRE